MLTISIIITIIIVIAIFIHTKVTKINLCFHGPIKGEDDYDVYYYWDKQCFFLNRHIANKLNVCTNQLLFNKVSAKEYHLTLYKKRVIYVTVGFAIL